VNTGCHLSSTFNPCCDLSESKAFFLRLNLQDCTLLIANINFYSSNAQIMKTEQRQELQTDQQHHQDKMKNTP